jgi:Protein of unknown function (DUF1579)
MTLTQFLALSVLLTSGLLISEDQPPEKKDDPQNKFEPRSAPGAGQKLLHKFVGEWEVAKTFHPRSGEPVRMNGECKQTMIHEGRFLQSEFVFKSGNTKTTGLGLIGFEAETGKFTSIWTDSRSTRMSLRQSQEPFKGDEIVLYGRSLNDEKQETRRSRTVTRLEEEGRKIVHRQYAIDADSKERLVMELVLTRKGDTPKKPDR